MLAQPLWKKLTIDGQSSATPGGIPEEYEGCYIVLSHVLYWTSYLMSVFEDQIKHGNTYASLWRSEWLAMPWILWESQIPSKKLSCPTGNTKWPLECDWFTEPRCLHLQLGKAVIRAHVSLRVVRLPTELSMPSLRVR